VVEADINRVIIFLRVAVSTTLGCPSVVEADINRVIIFLRVAVSTTPGCLSVVEAVIKTVGKWSSSYVKWIMLYSLYLDIYFLELFIRYSLIFNNLMDIRCELLQFQDTLKVFFLFDKQMSNDPC
jgi:hypothetical protein